MMQYAMDPCSFARPPPPGFFVEGPPPGFFGGFGSCARPAADVPARRPPPPGFFGDLGFCARPAVSTKRQPRRPPPPGFFAACPPAPCKVPVPPKLTKRKVSCVAADSAKRQRLCLEYEDDIDSNLRLTEKDAQERPLPDYLSKVQQDRVTPAARASLVGWMDQFVQDYDLADGTLHHAVAYVDRVLSVRAIATHHTGYELRLLGATAVFVAAKYEDQKTVRKLDADKIARYGEFATAKEVLGMESQMVAALGYQLGGPTAHTFLGHFMRYAQGEDDTKIRALANRLVDQALLNYAFIRFLPSVVAASAIFIARLLNPACVMAWNLELKELTGYDSLDMTACVLDMFSFSRSLNPEFHDL